MGGIGLVVDKADMKAEFEMIQAENRFFICAMFCQAKGLCGKDVGNQELESEDW
jgi:hypothetical protein